MDANMFGTCNDLGIGENSSMSQVRVYPNPTEDNVTVDLSNLNQSCVIELISPLGQLLRREQLTSNSSYNLSLEGLTNGLYFVNIYTNESLYQSIKIIKE
jgi:hypothetical protein